MRFVLNNMGSLKYSVLKNKEDWEIECCVKPSCDTRFNYQYHKKGWGGIVAWLKAPV